MQADVVIIGGGIVGLATAFKVLEKDENLSCLILEKEFDVALHQTGRNSGVIHSGIYYKPGSLKAKNCLNGYEMLIDFCEKEKVAFELCGKIIVATDESEIQALMAVYERGLENGLKGLELIDEKGIKEIEPHIKGVKAIKVPQTGIVDYVQMCKRLENLITQKGGRIQFNAMVEKLVDTENGVEIILMNGEKINGKYAINCSGLFSDRVASASIKQLNTRIIPFRGEYYELTDEAQHMVKHLVYPVPDPSFPFLGVHFTRMIHGGIEAGPNAVLAFKREGYFLSDFNWKDFWQTMSWPGFRKVMFKYWKTGLGEMKRSISKKAFTKALQKLLPEIQPHHLKKAPAGVRAQACDIEGGLLDDFCIEQTNNIIHVLNAPSPAATSALSIGDTVGDLLLQKMKLK
jgi:L-2-hydroxyglutarate oxidase